MSGEARHDEHKERKPPRKPKTGVNWDELRTLYITTTMSLKDIAEYADLSRPIVEQHSSRGGWVKARQEWRRETAGKAASMIEGAEVDRLVRIMHAANSMAAQIDNVFGDPEQFNRHLVTDTTIDGDGNKCVTTVERQYKAINTRAMRDLSASIKDMTAVLRNLNGLPTQAEAEAQRIAAERLRLEQRKADMQEAAQQLDKSIVVKLQGDLEEYAK